jgi:hypothetical protein
VSRDEIEQRAELVLIAHQRRDIRGCTCGTWGSDHGHLGQSHPGHVLERLRAAGLHLVGSRPCLYGEGRIAHIMYRHEGRPVSLFMLPNSSRSRELVEVLGHQAAIWCVGNRTFVLVAREPRREVERLASFVQASLH